jgi:hypothetical protein
MTMDDPNRSLQDPYAPGAKPVPAASGSSLAIAAAIAVFLIAGLFFWGGSSDQNTAQAPAPAAETTGSGSAR